MVLLNNVTASFDDVELSNQTDDGIQAEGSALDINGLEVSNSQSHGIDCNGSVITLSNSMIQNAGINGIDGYSSNGENCDLDLDQSIISNNAGSGISKYTELVASTVTLENNSNFGISIQNANETVVISSSTINSNGASGLSLDSVDATVNDSTLILNGAYGLTCTSSVTSSCSNNQLNDNAMGEQSGCDTTCGEEPVAQNETICNDGIDDDMDGLIDCDDSDCTTDAACIPLIETDCTDGVDNDLDGAFDCNDMDCMTDANCLPAIETDCTDGIDNDMNGLVDCDDAECMGDAACLPTTETICDDGIDDDMDGATDCDDSDCLSSPSCMVMPEANCEDGLDNDLDGLTDCDDSDCQSDSACTSLSYQTDVENILSASCGGCHGTNGGFTLSYSTMVGVPSSQVPSMNLVEAGDPATSYLWHKIDGTLINRW